MDFCKFNGYDSNIKFTTEKRNNDNNNSNNNLGIFQVKLKLLGCRFQSSVYKKIRNINKIISSKYKISY